MKPWLFISVTMLLFGMIYTGAPTCIRETGHSVSDDQNYQTYFCPNSFNPFFTLKVYPHKNVHIECDPNIRHDNYKKYLPELNFPTLEWIRFVMCSFDNYTKISDVLEILKINHTETVRIQNFGMKEMDETANNVAQFSNLGQLHRLEIMEGLNIKNLGSEIFNNLEELRWLDLKMNGIKYLDSGIFRKLRNLEFLCLSSNKLQNLPGDILESLGKLQILAVWGNSIDELPKNLLENQHELWRLDLGNNQLTSLPDDFLANLHQLKELYLPYNQISVLSDNSFVNNTELVTINLSNNLLTEIGSNLFVNQRKLKELKLDNCELIHIASDAFVNLVSLKKLVLSNNQLSELAVNVFGNTVQLTHLDLGFNKIANLPDGIFKSLMKLEELYLNDNNISYISSNLLRNLQKLTKLSLEHNIISSIDLNAFSYSRNIKQLYLNNNKLTSSSFYFSSPFSILSKLEILDLSENELTDISDDWRMSLIYLKELNLTHNKIKHLGVYQLTLVSKDVVVDLSNNEIESVDFHQARVFGNLNSLENSRSSRELLTDGKKNTVILGNNPIQCDCKIFDFLRYINGDKDMVAAVNFLKLDMQVENLKCTGPTKYNQRLVTSLQPAEVNCPYTTHCPKNCTCSVEPLHLVLLVNCSNQDFVTVPTDLPKSFRDMVLDISSNRIESINFTELPPPYLKISTIIASNNSIHTLDLNTTTYNKLKYLDLTSNKLQSLSSEVLNSLKVLPNVSLEGNPWNCDCSNIDFVLFVQKYYKQIPNYYNLACIDQFGRSVIDLTPNDVCPIYLAMYFTITVSLVSICLILSLAILYYRHETAFRVWLYAHNICPGLLLPHHRDDSTPKKYDAFVSFSNLDQEFIIKELIPNLEHPTNSDKIFKLCVHDRDWIPGEWIPNQIVHSVENSHRTIVVLSKNYLRSVWARMEFRAAHLSALKQRSAQVIVIKLEDLDEDDVVDRELKAYLKMNTFLSWGSKNFWDQLRYALPHKMVLSQHGSTLSKIIGKKVVERNIEQEELKLAKEKHVFIV